MSDYISREEAEKVFSQPVTMSMCLTLEECKQKNAQRQIDLFVIRGLPAADVQPVVRGKWIGTHDGFYYSYSCSECGYEALYKENTKDQVCSEFCPNCGARMGES